MSLPQLAIDSIQNDYFQRVLSGVTKLLNPSAGFDEDIENMLIACVVDAELGELTHQMTGSGLRRRSEDGDVDRSQWRAVVSIRVHLT